MADKETQADNFTNTDILAVIDTTDLMKQQSARDAALKLCRKRGFTDGLDRMLKNEIISPLEHARERAEIAFFQKDYKGVCVTLRPFAREKGF